jgi:hypothetical protein
VALLNADSPASWRFFSRIALAILVPAVLAVWLFHSASVQEESIHSRDTRWLAQMGENLRKRIQHNQDIVASVAKDLRESSADKDSVLSAVGNLQLVEAGCAARKPLEVRYQGGVPKITFVNSDPPAPTCLEADLGTLVGKAIRADAFDSVILADHQGSVMYQSEGGETRLTDVRFLFTGAAPEHSSLFSSLKGDSDAAKKAGTAPNDPGSGGIPTATQHLFKTIGDREFGIFVQPVELDQEHQFVLIGMAERQSLLKQSAPGTLMVLLPFALLLVIAGWPLPKLWFMSPAATLRRRDIGQIVGCTLTLVLLLSCLFLYRYVTARGNRATDQRLYSLAQAIGKDFTAELRQTAFQLQALDNLATKVNREGGSTGDLYSALRNLPAREIFSAFEYVDWIEVDGTKKVRWSPLNDNTLRPISVADRTYFKDARDGRTYSIDGSPPFAIEQVLSRTTNELLLMMGMPSVASKKQPVTDLALRPLSVSNPVVADGYGFAILDADGTALFHSEPSRIFVENLFEECPERPELRWIATRRVQAYSTTNYEGTPHRMLVRPIPGLEGLPWTLVVYRDMSRPRMMRIQVLWDTIVAFAAYAAVLALLTGCIFLVLRAIRLLPRNLLGLSWWSHRQGAFPNAATAGIVMLVIAWRALNRQDGPELFYTAVWLTAVFIGVSAAALRRPMGGRWIRSGWASTAAVPVAAGVSALTVGDWEAALVAVPLLAASGVLLTRWCGRLTKKRYASVQVGSWVAWNVMLVLMLCSMPVFFLGRFAYDYEEDLAGRNRQWSLWQAENTRSAASAAQIEKVGGSEWQDKQANLKRAAGLIQGAVGCPALGFYGTASAGTVVLSQAAEIAPSASAVNSGQVLSRCAPQADAPPPDICRLEPGDSNTAARAKSLPVRMVAAVELPLADSEIGFDARYRGLTPAGGLWEWRQDRTHPHWTWLCAGARPVSWSMLPVFGAFQALRSGSPAPAWVQDPLVASAAGAPLEPRLELWGGISALVVVLALWIRKLRAKVMLAGVMGDPREFTEKDLELPRLFLITPSGACPPVFAQAASASGGNGADVDRGAVIEDLGAGLRDETERLTELGWIEGLLGEKGKVVIASSVDPLRYLENLAQVTGKAPEPGEIARWRRAMTYFEYRSLGAGQTSGRAQPDWATVWESCGADEKRVLCDLWKHRIVNPQAEAVVQTLIGRGLILRRASGWLELPTAGLRRFVARVYEPPDRTLPGTAGHTRLPLLAVVMLVGGILVFLSQEEVATRAVGFLTTLAGGYGAIRKQFTGQGGAPDQ